MSTKVNKALSPEEMMLVSNIQSLLDEMVQMQSGGAPVEEAPVEEAPVVQGAEGAMDAPAMEEETTEGKEIKMILKALEATQSEGATASDDAEERVEDPLPDLTEENVTEVAKTAKLLNALIKKSQAPKKSVDPSLHLLDKVAGVLKSNNERMDQLSEAFTHIAKGMGLNKQLEVAKAEQERRENVNKASSTQNDDIIKVLKDLVGTKQEPVKKSSNSVSVQKNLADREVLTGLFGPRR